MTPEERRALMAEASAPIDLAALAVCNALGHLFEGRLAEVSGDELRLVGRCQRCGAGVLADG